MSEVMVKKGMSVVGGEGSCQGRRGPGRVVLRAGGIVGLAWGITGAWRSCGSVSSSTHAAGFTSSPLAMGMCLVTPVRAR